MKRRELLKHSLLAGGVSTLSFPSILRASRKDQFRWRLVMAIPKTLPIWGEGVSQFAEKIKIMTDGGLTIRVYGAGELVPALGTFDAIQAGQVEMGHSAAYYWQGKIPASVFFCSVPFGLDMNGMRAWLAYGGGQLLWDKLYAPFGVIALAGGNTGMQMGGWFRKPIDTIKDFSGLKIRIPGVGGQVLAKLGANPILVAGGEIFTSLTTGVIDAAEWVGPYHDYLLGLHKAASYYYYPGWHEPGPTLELMINKQAWQKLPAYYQQIVRTAAMEMDWQIGSHWLAKDAEYLEKLKNEQKIKIQAFPSSVLTKLYEMSEIVKSEIAKSDPMAKKIYDSYVNFQKSYKKLLDISSKKYFEILG